MESSEEIFDEVQVAANFYLVGSREGKRRDQECQKSTEVHAATGDPFEADWDSDWVGRQEVVDGAYAEYDYRKIQTVLGRGKSPVNGTCGVSIWAGNGDIHLALWEMMAKVCAAYNIPFLQVDSFEKY